MIVGSIILLFSALNPVKEICAYDDQKHLGWKGLQHLILLFIGGHIIFGYYLVTNEVTFIHVVITVVFLGAGWFVSMVSRLNLGNIERFNKAIQAERHRALHDPLTALPNRILFHERIDHALSFAKREQKEIALMIIDLNEFKEVNDSLGHQAGDKLLFQASQRLKEVLRESDTLARFGGDEFAVILPQSSKRQADVLAKRLTMAIRSPFMVEGCTLTIGMSVGIAMYPSHGRNSEALIKHADQEMYREKRDQKAFLATDDEINDTRHIDLVSAASTAKKHAAQNEKRLLN